MFCSCVHLQVVFNESNDAFQVITRASDVRKKKKDADYYWEQL